MRRLKSLVNRSSFQSGLSLAVLKSKPYSRTFVPRWKFPDLMPEQKMESSKLDQLCIDAIRVLAMDAVQKADSGHPGTPMALAPLAYVLFTRHMHHNPADPSWPNRDRFVLSCGHASMLLYSALYLSGYDLSLDDLKQFRQWQSRTPGHPEYGHTCLLYTSPSPRDRQK